MKLATRADGAITTPIARILVHPAVGDKPNWEWTQVSRNGMASARSPKPYETKDNAKRAAHRQSYLLDPARAKGETSAKAPVEIHETIPPALLR